MGAQDLLRFWYALHPSMPSSLFSILLLPLNFLDYLLFS
ncbi:hypothetical protein Ahy_A10g048979 isoform G [Arachis hypogaea]|uniref:Uncharacterized protein n=1 Tax=Arachis hypogaea TaxID=3818 RepID=A0A445B6B3_ARAHY|nr:hypothetical protein Ahy_A10g048979 isoform G [Arachis hypogaea]